MAEVKRYPNFDVLRLLAAFGVAVLHCTNIPKVHIWGFPVPFVPVFVCLSGFLIPGSFSSSRGWGHFAWKRALRILPALVISIVLAGLLLGPPAIPASLTVYLSMGLIAAHTWGNGPLWSLMLEEVLYATHAVSRILRGLWSLKAVCVYLVLTLCVWQYLRVGYPFYRPGFGADKYLGPVACYLAGNALSFMKPRIHWGWCLVGLALSAPFISLVTPLAVPLSCAFAVLLAYNAPQVPIGKFPDVSYGLYVYHVPILVRVSMLGYGVAFNTFVTIPLAFGLSFVSWYAVEKWALRLKDWRLLRTPQLDPVPVGLKSC